MANMPREAAKLIADLKRRVDVLERKPRLMNASVDGGRIPFLDDAGQVREVVGRQSDGSYGSLAVKSDPQPTPINFEVSAGDRGAVEVSWGGDADGDVPLIHGRVEVWSQHVSEGGTVDVGQAKLRSSIRDRDGGATTIACPVPGVWAIWLRMVGQDRETAGGFSDPMFVEVAALFDVSDFEERLNAFAEGELEDAAYNSLMARLGEFLLVRTDQLDANAINGMTVTAPLLQSHDAGNRGWKHRPDGTSAWFHNTSGRLNTEINMEGEIFARGADIQGRFQTSLGTSRAEIDQGNVTYFSPINNANRTLNQVPYLRFSTPDGAGGTTEPLIAAKPTGGLVLGSGRNSPEFGRSVVEIDGHLNALGADFTSHVNTTSVYASIGITGIGTNATQLGGIVASGGRTRLQGRTADSHNARDMYVRGSSSPFILPNDNSIYRMNFTYGEPVPQGDRLPFVTCSTQLADNSNGRMAIVGVGNISASGFQGVAINAGGGSPVAYNLLYNALWR